MMEKWTLILLGMLIVAGLLQFLVLVTFLSNLQSQVTKQKQIQDLYHKDNVNQFQFIRFVKLLELKELCIKREEYEKVQRIDKILKTFPDFLKESSETVAPTKKRSDL